MYRDVYNIFFNDFVFCVREMEITIQKNLMKLLEIFLISIPFLIYIQHIRTVHAVWILNIQQWVQSAQSRREQSTSQTARFHAGDGDGFATDGWSRTDMYIQEHSTAERFIQAIRSSHNGWTNDYTVGHYMMKNWIIFIWKLIASFDSHNEWRNEINEILIEILRGMAMIIQKFLCIAFAYIFKNFQTFHRDHHCAICNFMPGNTNLKNHTLHSIHDTEWNPGERGTKDSGSVNI